MDRVFIRVFKYKKGELLAEFCTRLFVESLDHRQQCTYMLWVQVPAAGLAACAQSTADEGEKVKLANSIDANRSVKLASRTSVSYTHLTLPTTPYV